MADEIESIKAEILQFPTKEFYPGFFKDFQEIKEKAKQRAAFGILGLKPPAPGSALDILAQSTMDTGIKAGLIAMWRRKQAAND